MRSNLSFATIMERKEQDSSDYDSDAGASPSFSDSDSSSVSSRASSPGALRIVEPNFVTPKKRVVNDGNGNASCNATTRTSKRKTAQSSASKPKQSGAGSISIDGGGVAPPNSKNTSSPKPVVINGAVNTNTASCRKRKRQSDRNMKSNRDKASKLLLHNSSKKLCLNQRRRTKSERNTRAGKTIPVPVEESVALDAEIDKLLEDKAMKNNLTATNVKSIIRHVITNNMVQKMIMSTGKKKGANPDDSSGDEALYEPKLTRARTKQLFGDTHTRPLWPSLAVTSPVKSKNKPISETHVLIHEELPEDSSGDEEYVPNLREDDAHSDDESSSVASTSEKGSPCPVLSTSKRSTMNVPRTRQGNKEKEESEAASNNNNFKEERSSPVFKTPTPVRPKYVRRLDSGISKRTRSKLPLNDTPLEDLEMQLIPPDITTDMYDWGLSDNEDYLAFVKEFLCPGQNTAESNEAGDDDEVADPEYNVMDEEEEHDKEELRMDRAVKVSKKELNELVAELLEESHFTSGDELDDTEFASFCASQLSHMTVSSIQELNSPSQSANSPVQPTEPSGSRPQSSPEVTISSSNLKKSMSSNHPAPNYAPVNKREEKGTQNPERDLESTTIQSETIVIKNKVSSVSNLTDSKSKDTLISPLPPGRISITSNCILPVTVSCHDIPSSAVSESVNTSRPELPVLLYESSSTRVTPEPLFNSDMICILKHQFGQHTQLLAQSYVLTVNIDDPTLKEISFHSKRMINEMRNVLVLDGAQSILSGGNLESAWSLVNSWPPKSSKSPIKKKILEEKYINDCKEDINGYSTGKDGSGSTQRFSFPRHVAKVIAESSAFPYPKLLPLQYSQTSAAVMYFTLSEDKLIVCAYEDLKEYTKMTTNEKAAAIARTLMPARTAKSIFHRIKNLRRNNILHRDPAITEYFESGKPLPGARVPEYFQYLRAPIAQPKTELPPVWQALLSRLVETSEFNWTRRRNELEILNGKSRRKTKKKSSNSIHSETASSLNSSPTSSPDKPKLTKDHKVVSSVFPVGYTVLQIMNDKDQDTESFAIRDDRGNPKMWVSVPKWCPGKFEQIVINGRLNDSGLEKILFEFSPPKLNDDHRKNLQLVDTIVRESTAVPEKDSVSVTAVGEPFYLPSDLVQESDVIDLASLATPLKRAILESAEGPGFVPGIDNGLSCTELESETRYNLEIENSRDQHSARTFGGTRSKLSESKLNGYNEYDDALTDSSESSESDESMNGDDSPSSAEGDTGRTSPIQVIEEVVISSDDETPISSSSDRKVDPSESGGDNNKSDNKSSVTSGQGTSNTSGKHTTSSEGMFQNPSSSSVQLGAKRGRREDDEEDKNRKNNRRNPRDYSDKGNPDIAEQEETEDEETEVKDQANTQLKKQKCLNKRKDTKRNKNPTKEKSKKSPSNSNAVSSGIGKKRPMKSSKCTPVEKMLDEDRALDEEISEAFLESFLHRLQAATEKKHPGLNNEFVKLLCEAEQSTSGNSDQELLAKVRALLKEYPELLAEFTTFIESDENQIPLKEDEHFQEKQKNDAYILFLRHLEKFTERNPQLKAKILHKLKVFSESSNPSQREMAESLEPFFQGNEVMMRAFAAILPSVYRPDSINNPLDFEIVDMESEDFGSQDDQNVESVTLPEEKTVPASNTCPCVCHDPATATHVYSTRAKHCHKCCLKFQDGKVFVHNGRVTKQVNVEMTSASDAKKKSSGNTCKSCVQDSGTVGLKFKESFGAVLPTSSKPKEEMEFKKPKAHASHHLHGLQTTMAPSSTITSSSHLGHESLVDAKVNSSSTKVEHVKLDDPTFKTDRKSWTLQEDHLILTAVKSVSDSDLDEAFERLTSELPNRDRTEVESRCVELISILQSELGSSIDDPLNE